MDERYCPECERDLDNENYNIYCSWCDDYEQLDEYEQDEKYEYEGFYGD